MKYISLSFDDGRADTYTNALPILKKYGLTATVNVISDFVIHPEKYTSICPPQRAMTVKEIKEWESFGFEVACHGATHQNTAEDVIQNIKELQSFGIDTEGIGFASPTSFITEKNVHQTGIDQLKKEGKISYIRTGIQVRREGFVYTFLSIVEKITHSSWLYYRLNRRNIIRENNIPELLPSTAIKSYTTLKQVKYLINKMPENSYMILMLHSILKKNDSFYGKDNYFWDADKFEGLCSYLAGDKDITVMTTKEMVNRRVLDVCSIDWGLTPLHNKMLEILEYIDGFCTEHSIEYSLAYGSALGAARHGGFIPWDDDVDIYMTAEGYKLFRKLFSEIGDKQRFYLQEIENIGDMVTMAKLRLNGTTFIEPLYKEYDMHQGIYIDIFVLFDAPRRLLKRRVMNLANQYLVLKGLSNRHYVRRKAFVPLLAFLRLFPRNFLRKWALTKLYENKELSHDVYDTDMRTYKKSFYPKSYVFPAKRILFAGKSLCVPGDIDLYLRRAYDDYMSVPSIESIKRSQHAMQWDISIDYKEYLKMERTCQK